MALQPQFVNRIFTRLLARYGTAWIRAYEGVDDKLLKADWADQLAGFDDKPMAIKHALDNLPPDRPPNAAQFRALCNTAPLPAFKALPPPKVDREKALAALAPLRTVFKPQADLLAWAKKLRDDEAAGRVLTERQRMDWRLALATVPEAVVMADFNPIGSDRLPPGMREAGY